MARVAEGLGFSRRDFVVKGAAAGATLAAGSVAGTGKANAARGGSGGPADLALVNGNILTLDANNTVAGSIAITDGRIAAVTGCDSARATGGAWRRDRPRDRVVTG